MADNTGVGMADTIPNQADADRGSDNMATPTPKRTTSPAFQFYPKDFISSTKVQRMSLTEIGAYTLLLSHCWLDNGLPTDVAQLARIVKVPEKQFARMWAGALSECFYEAKGRIHNDRLDRERKKQADFRRRQSDAAVMRWDKVRESRGNATASRRQSRKHALQSPISDLQSPDKDLSKEQKDPGAHPIREFLALYESLFSERFGSKPVINGGRDSKIAKDAIGRFGDEKASALLRAFFASDDPFIQKSGYGLNIFAGQLNKLLVGDRATASGSARTAGNLAALQEFASRGRTA